MQAVDPIADMSSEGFYVDVAVTNLSKSEIDPQLGVLSCDIELTCLSPWYKMVPDVKLTTLFADHNGTYLPPFDYDGYDAVIATVEKEPTEAHDKYTRNSYAYMPAPNTWINVPVYFDCVNCDRMLTGFTSFNSPILFSENVRSVNNLLSYTRSYNQPLFVPDTCTSWDLILRATNNFNSTISVPNNRYGFCGLGPLPNLYDFTHVGSGARVTFRNSNETYRYDNGLNRWVLV